MSEIGVALTFCGVALNCKDLSCWHVVIKAILFLVSTGLAVFNTRTDWNVVFSYQKVGFNNPLLPRSTNWLRALFLFASVGTILTIITVFHDGLVLLYSTYKAFKTPCCKKKSSGENILSKDDHSKAEGENLKPIGDLDDPPKHNDDTSNQSKCDGNTDSPSKHNGDTNSSSEPDNDSDDPFKPCYHCGCNVDTRSETLGCIGLWFQDVPMLTIAILYAFSQTTCKVPDNRDVTPILRDIGISATAATLTSFWKLFRSFYRVYMSVGVRIKEDGRCTNCTRIQKCFPKKGDALYPKGSPIAWCIFPFFIGLAFQLSAILMAVGVTTGIWISYGILLATPNSDNSLGIYRISTSNFEYVQLFNISDILSSNGTMSFVHLEQIPRSELFYNGDIFCLSEFNYRSDESQIFFNVVQVEVVSSDNHFCIATDGFGSCELYYSYLSYASIEPITGEVELFTLQCSVVQYDLYYDGEPVIDSGIDVTRHINRSNFPLNGEQLVIFYPSPISVYLPVAIITTVGTPIIHTFQDIVTAANITCSIRFVHDLNHGRINFNYRDVYNYQQANCSCNFPPGLNCNQFHGNLLYAYATQDGFVTPYTHCSDIPEEKLKPYHDLIMAVDCPC